MGKKAKQKKLWKARAEALDQINHALGLIQGVLLRDAIRRMAAEAAQKSQPDVKAAE